MLALLYYLCAHSCIVSPRQIYHSSWLQNSEAAADIIIMTVNNVDITCCMLDHHMMIRRRIAWYH